MTTKKLPHGRRVTNVRPQRRLWYMAMYYAGSCWHPHVFGRRSAASPKMYRTFRGANKRAGEGGRVLAIDLEAMPVAIEDAQLDDREIPEEQFAERQFGLWGETMKRLSKGSS